MPVIKDKDSNWYQGWYFDLRLEEELARCTRYDIPLSLIVFIIREPATSEANSRLLNELLDDIVVEKLRRTDLPGVLASNEYAVSLPHTLPAQANIVARRVAKAFAPFTIGTGLVSYPEDGAEPEQLLSLAEQRALASFLPSGEPEPAKRSV